MPPPTISREAFLARCVADPELFCRGMLPWGEAGTLLATETGLDTWQLAVLEALRQHLLTSAAACRLAVASGHGIGKSCLSALLVLWFLTTRPHCQIVVTANTGTQLATKTWREVAKWLRLSGVADLLEWHAQKLTMRAHPDTWFASAIAWSRDHPEAFAGTHERHVLLVMDEASAIDDAIWDTAEGAMTTPGALWLAFGNPTRPTGRFRECFAGGRFAHRWQTFQVDSRTAKMADRTQLEQWMTDWGADSDFVRVRVLGQFPRQAVEQFISEASVNAALARPPVADPLQPVIVGVDVARFGDDRSVIVVRQGGTLRELRVYREIDTARLTGYLCERLDALRAEAPTTFIDAVGLGAGVVDQCRARGYAVNEVLAGVPAQDPVHYVNKRCEMHDRVRQWLKTRASLPAGTDWVQECCGVEYDYATGKLRLEGKEHMKARGLASPDILDALALTFAEPVALRGMPPPPPPPLRQGPPWVRQRVVRR